MTVDMRSAPFGVADFSDRAVRRGDGSGPEAGDFRYNPDATDAIRAMARKDAAVLVSVIERGDTALGNGAEAMAAKSQSVARAMPVPAPGRAWIESRPKNRSQAMPARTWLRSSPRRSNTNSRAAMNR